MDGKQLRGTVEACLRPASVKIVSIDAIGCQRSIAEGIIGQRADYLIGLKASQGGLCEQVADWFERTKSSLQAHISRDLGHGRGEKRTVRVSENLDLIDATVGWPGIGSMVYVDSIR